MLLGDLSDWERRKRVKCVMEQRRDVIGCCKVDQLCGMKAMAGGF